MIKNSVVVRRIAPIVLIMYLPVKDFFSFIFNTTNIKINPSIFDQKPSYLFIFFTFNVLLVALMVGFYAHLSRSSSPSSSPVDSYGLDRDHHHDSIPEMFYVDYENGSNLYFKNDEIAEEEEKDDFVPEIVHVGYLNREEEVVMEEREHDDHEDDGVVICDGEDDEEEDGYSELDDLELNKRIEEFIGVNNKKRNGGRNCTVTRS